MSIGAAGFALCVAIPAALGPERLRGRGPQRGRVLVAALLVVAWCCMAWALYEELAGAYGGRPIGSLQRVAVAGLQSFLGAVTLACPAFALGAVLAVLLRGGAAGRASLLGLSGGLVGDVALAALYCVAYVLALLAFVSAPWSHQTAATLAAIAAQVAAYALTAGLAVRAMMEIDRA